MGWVVGQKHEKFREFRTPFPPRDIRKNSSQHVRACAAGDGAICSKNRIIVPYHGDSPNTRNGARLRSPSPIMAPGWTQILDQTDLNWLVIGTALSKKSRSTPEVFRAGTIKTLPTPETAQEKPLAPRVGPPGGGGGGGGCCWVCYVRQKYTSH